LSLVCYSVMCISDGRIFTHCRSVSHLFEKSTTAWNFAPGRLLAYRQSLLSAQE
jgi:hypothetical protein